MYRALCLLWVLFTAFGCLAAGELRLAPAPVGTGITYQGRLADDGLPANGAYDFEFKLFEGLSTSSQVGSTVTVNDLVVANGLFSTLLDFGEGIFNGQILYLQISVRPGADAGAYTDLTPRQLLTAAPYALGLRCGAEIRGIRTASALYVENNATTCGRAVSARGAGSGGTFGPEACATVQAYNAAVDEGYAVIGNSGALSHAVGTAGFASNASGGGGVGVHGETVQNGYDGAGVRAVYRGEGGGTALEVRNGAIRTTGDHRMAFTHLTTTSNVNDNFTEINHPLLNGDPYALVFVTRNFITGAAYHNHVVGVWYNPLRDRWTIFNEDLASMHDGITFNVLVIKQEVFK
ncbi:MAG: hypothetical protein KA419_09220 [Acidobacteria bacterium]|nr:hypothetical protein [Acidobacteriota bacterium]